MTADDRRNYEAPPEQDEGPVLARRPMEDTAELDITPMIDITFLLLIFFLVCSTASMQMSVELPPAQYGKGVSERTAVILTVVSPGEAGPAEVYVGSSDSGDRLPDDPAAQEAAVTAAVEAGFRQGNSTVLVKAHRKVKHSEVSRVAAAAGLVEGIQLHMAVLEME